MNIIKFIVSSLSLFFISVYIVNTPKEVFVISTTKISERTDYLLYTMATGILIYVVYVVYESGIETAKELKKSKVKLEETLAASEKCLSIINNVNR